MPPHPLRLTTRDVTPRPVPAQGGIISRKVAAVIGAIVERWYPEQAFVGSRHAKAPSDPITVNNFLVLAQPTAPQPVSNPAAQRDAEKDAALVLLNAVAANPRQRAKVRIAGDKWEGAPEGEWILTIERAPKNDRLAAPKETVTTPSAKEIS